MPRSILTNLMGRTRAGLGLKFAPAAAAPDDRSQQPLLKRLDREPGKQVFGGPAVVSGLRFELKLFGREVHCSRPSATRELEVIARRSACEASQRPRTRAQATPYRKAQQGTEKPQHELSPSNTAVHASASQAVREDILRISRGMACPELGSAVRVGRPETAAVLLCMSLSMSCQVAEAVTLSTAVTRRQLTFHGWAHCFAFLPESINSPAERRVPVSEIQTFFCHLSLSDEQWMST